MTQVLIGIVIGAVMGLTGAGGALISIPLFMEFLGMNLKEASLYSLVAVIIASFFNFLSQKSFTHYRSGILIVVLSALGSFLAAPFKALLPSLWIAVILSFISLYAVFSVWLPDKENQSSEVQDHHLLSIVVGIILGVLTTFTGLGGGVLMLPIFTRFYKYSQKEAVATSLFAVGFSSVSSLLIQIYHGAKFEIESENAYLVFGIMLAAFTLKKLSSTLSSVVLKRTRQVVFSIVVIVALAKVFQ